MNLAALSFMSRRIAGLVLITACSMRPPVTVPFETEWPRRWAVGMRSGGQLFPYTMEALSSGWIVLTPLTARPDIGALPPPTQRLVLRREDVVEWIPVARRFVENLGRVGLTAPNISAPLGAGTTRILLHESRGSRNLVFELKGCGSGSLFATPDADEVLRFLALLDSAAEMAGQGRSRPIESTRVHYASEVSCPARPLPGNALLPFPADVPRPGLRPVEIGVRFVVDTLGRVDGRSFAVLPNTDPRFAAVARETISRWRFEPAVIETSRVPQLVQTAVLFDPDAFADSTVGITLYPGVDGWVRAELRFEPGIAFAREWFRPDSVEAWIPRLRALLNEAAELGSPRAGEPDRLAMLHAGARVGIGAGYGIRSGIVRRITKLVRCDGNDWEAEGVPERRIASLARAVEVTRSMHETPIDPKSVIHEGFDVACPAWLPWKRSTATGFERVWRYPVAEYPDDLARTNARAEVLVSFVVDTLGVPDPSTLAVIPSADSRAVRALPAAVAALRFRPASRGGVVVPQRVIHLVLFEPPPICGSPVAGPSC